MAPGGSSSKPVTSERGQVAPTEHPPTGTAERRHLTVMTVTWWTDGSIGHLTRKTGCSHRCLRPLRPYHAGLRCFRGFRGDGYWPFAIRTRRRRANVRAG
jgi:hypothetical protein